MSKYEEVEELAVLLNGGGNDHLSTLARSFLECNDQRKQLAKKLGSVMGWYHHTEQGKIHICGLCNGEWPEASQEVHEANCLLKA